MRKPAISAVLVAGSWALAWAQPLGREPPSPRPDQDVWIEIATATPASHGREYILVGADAGAFTRLRIDAASGRPTVHAVRVDYFNGTSAMLRVDATLDRAHRRSAVLDLGGAHKIDQLLVITDRASSGSYAVFGAGVKTEIARHEPWPKQLAGR